MASWALLISFLEMVRVSKLVPAIYREKIAMISNTIKIWNLWLSDKLNFLSTSPTINGGGDDRCRDDNSDRGGTTTAAAERGDDDGGS